MERRLAAILLAAFLGLGSAGAQGPADPLWQHQQERQRAAAITVGKDGITQHQAELLAKIYMLSELGACGATSTAERTDSAWLVPVRLGVGGREAGAIRVDRFSAAISYPHYPTRYPKDFAREERLR
jgi:hypothetical protein